VHAPEWFTRIGQSPVLVAVILAPAALIGFAIGTWLGDYGPGAQATVTAVTPPVTTSASAEPAATPTPTPLAVRTPAPTQVPAATSGPTVVSEPASTVNGETPGQVVVLDISGSGDLTSEPFEVREGWQLQWQTEGEAFTVAIRGDQDFGTIIDQPGSASGVTSPVPTGTFRIEVTAVGPWSIQVLQGN
jgi:hypothetical protein